MTADSGQVFEMWKQQAETSMKLVAAMVEAGAKLQAAQVAYSRSLFETMNEANSRILQCMQESAPACAQDSPAQGAKVSTALTVPGDMALRLWGDMYRQMDSFTRSMAQATGASLSAAPRSEESEKQAQASA